MNRCLMKFMKTRLLSFVGVVLIISGCNPKKPFHEVQVKNPVFIPNTIFREYEDLTSPKFIALKEKYQLDTIFHGETDELKRILLLRHWVSRHIKIDNYGPYA